MADEKPQEAGAIPIGPRDPGAGATPAAGPAPAAPAGESGAVSPGAAAPGAPGSPAPVPAPSAPPSGSPRPPAASPGSPRPSAPPAAPPGPESAPAALRQTPPNGLKAACASEAVPEMPVICVGIRPDGSTIRGLMESVGELESLLEETEFAWVNVRCEDVNAEVPKIAERLGFHHALVPPVLQDRPSAYEDLDADLAIRIPAVRVTGLDVSIHPLLVFMRRGLILTASDRQVVRLARFSRYAEPFFKKIPRTAAWNDKLSIILTRIIDENNERNYDGLRTIEEEADGIGQCLADPTSSRTKIGEAIYKMKHALISYLNALWATQDAINTLRYGDADVITDSEPLLAKIEMLGMDVTRHIQLSENLSEVLASGLEILQGIYNNQLQILSNRMTNVMTWLTILGTAVLVPNTIATAMGSTAFALEPSDKWWYLTLLVASTVVATVAVYYVIRRKMKMPTDVE